MNHMIEDSIKSSHLDIANRLQQYIARKGYQPGDQLPVREELIRELKIGPRRLREGLHVLAYHGLIETRSKAGTIVREPSADVLSSPVAWHLDAAGCEADDLLRARAAMEGAAAWEAAQRRKPRDLLVLLDALEALEQREQARELDLDEEQAFHVGILKAANNPAMMMMEQIIVACLDRARAMPTSHDNPQYSNVEHRRIYEAIEARDSRTAMQLTYDHILSHHAG